MSSSYFLGQRSVNFKFMLLCFLYISQYLPLAFFSVVLPVILRQGGVGFDKIGLLYLITLPWLLKFLWAPLVDKYGNSFIGHYKSWIIPMQLLLTLSCIMLSFISPVDNYNQLFFWGAISCLASATQDIATDATAVLLLDEKERSLGNGIQSAAGLLSHLLGGGVLLLAYNYLQWQGCMLILAIAVMLPLLLVLFYKEKTQPISSKNQSGIHFIAFFRRPGMKRWVLLLIIAISSVSLSHGLLPTLLVDKAWDNTQIALSIALLGGLAGALSSVFSGKMMQRITRKKALVLNLFVQALTLSGILLPIYFNQCFVISYIGISISYLGYGMAVTALYTINMDNCQPETAGSDYSLQDCIGNFGQIAINPLSLFCVGMFGYGTVVFAGIGFGLLAVMLVGRFVNFK